MKLAYFSKNDIYLVISLVYSIFMLPTFCLFKDGKNDHAIENKVE